MARAIFKYFLITVALFFCSVAKADDAPHAEWRILGPAFSYHVTKEGAATTRPATETQQCRDWENAQQQPTVVSATPLPYPYLTLIGRDANGNYIYRPLPTATPPPQCTTTQVPAERGWHGNNPAIGVEYTLRYEAHSDKLYGQFVGDSYGRPGLMLGAARQWSMYAGHGLTIDAGMSGGLWWRTDLDQQRHLVPFVFPVLSVSEERTGLGMNFALAPKLSINGRVYVSTPTLMMQVTYRVR